ncbi:MAG: NUDIX hydrolase [Candidatus Rifleibacteriota bacterium]
MNQVSAKILNPEIRIRITVLIKSEDGRICFVRHNKNGKIYWLLPGGGQKPLETAYEAAFRELEEELRIKCKDFRFLFARESMNKEIGRHILFMVFEGLNPELSSIATGTDERVEGYDFFNIQEISERPIYPSMKEDIINFLENRKIEPFKTLEWIP